MKSILMIFVTLAVVCAKAGDATNEANTIQQEAGDVCGQLDGYDWQPRRDVGELPSQIVSDFRFWINATLAKPYYLPETVPVKAHVSTNGTCDALCAEYTKDDLSFTIIQTRRTMLIKIKGDKANVADVQQASKTASQLARQIFPQTNSITLVTNRIEGRLCFGGMMRSSQEDVSWPTNGIWKGGFMTYRWWSNGNEINFFGAKMPFNSTAPYMFSDLTDTKANQWWFSQNPNHKGAAR